MKTITLFGCAVFALFALIAVTWEVARGSDRPPPVIVPVVRIDRHPTAIAESPREVAAPDGPMCQMPLPDDHEPATLLGALLEEPASEGESAEVTMQMSRCWRGQTRAADPFLVLALYRYEETLGVPAHARGILGAIWCSESAFRMRSSRIPTLPIRGDWGGGWAGAHGPFQLHSWAEDSTKCGLVAPPDCRKNDCFREGGRDDLFAAAHCWWQRVEARVESPFVRYLKCRDPYPLAEALVSDQGRYSGQGCRAKSSHWLELVRWRS